MASSLPRSKQSLELLLFGFERPGVAWFFALCNLESVVSGNRRDTFGIGCYARPPGGKRREPIMGL